MSAKLSPLPSTLSRDAFLESYGGVFEVSPWVAEAVWPHAQEGSLDEPQAMGDAMRAVIAAASDAQKLTLLRAHPDLASTAALASGLMNASARERAGVGLDAWGPEELAELHALNAGYKEKFGFPFVIAARGRTRAEILAAFRKRLGNTYSREMATAIDEAGRIGQLRLDELAE
jgi:OHCU decarboxylase